MSQSLPRFSRWTLAGAALALLLATTEGAVAGTAEQPEILDLLGDVAPLTALYQLPPNAAVAHTVDLYDINRTYVFGESRDFFSIRVHLADIPDQLGILPPGWWNGTPLPPLPSPLPPVPWSNDYLNGFDNVTAHFTIRKANDTSSARSFDAVASLLQVVVQGPKALPDPALTPSTMTINTGVYVPPQEIPVGPTTITVPGTYVTTSTTVVLPVDPGVQKPDVLLFNRFTLRDEDGTQMPIFGSIDVRYNFIQFLIPKQYVGAPIKGDALTEFYAQTTAKSDLVKMDCAPDCANVDLAQLPSAEQILDQGLTSPRYGADYNFTYTPLAYRRGYDPGALASLKVDFLTPTQQEIEPGASALYQLRLRNVGSSTLSGLFSVSNAGSGWTHQLSASSWTLAAGDSTTVSLSVTGLTGGSLEDLARLVITQTGAASKVYEFHTTLKDHAKDKETHAKKKRVPGFETMTILLTLAALVVAVRRRD